MQSILSGCCLQKAAEHVQMNEFPEGTLSLPHIGSGTSDSTYLIYAPRGCAGILRIPHLRFASESQSDQNTVAKYRPCSSTFCGNCSFCTLPKAPLLPEVSEADRYFLPKYKRHKFLYIVSMRKILILKTSCVHWRGGRLFPASVYVLYRKA